MTHLCRIIVAVMLALSLIGCSEGPDTGPAQTTVTIGRRQVNTFLDVPGGIVAEGDKAVATAANMKIEIEKERVVIDGNDSGPIPPAATRIDVTIAGGTLTVSADDEPVVTLAVKGKSL